MNKIMEQQEKYLDFLGIIHAAMAAYKIPETDEVCEVFTAFSNVMESIIAPDMYAERVKHFESEYMPHCQTNSNRPPMPRTIRRNR